MKSYELYDRDFIIVLSELLEVFQDAQGVCK